MEPKARSRQLRSPAWEYFVPVVLRETARCKLCDAIIRTTKGTTTGLGRHLAIYHSNRRRENVGASKMGFLKEQGAAGARLKRQVVVPIDKTGPQPQRMLVSPAWEFFDPLVFKETAKCKICEAVVKTTGGTTSGLSRHLASRHGGNLKTLRNEISLKNQRQNPSHGTVPKIEIESDDELQDHTARLAKEEKVTFQDSEMEDDDPLPDERRKEVVVAKTQVPVSGETQRAKHTLKQKRRLTSIVWKYFTRDEKKDTAKCSICDAVFLFKTSSGTSSLGRHLEARHMENLTIVPNDTSPNSSRQGMMSCGNTAETEREVVSNEEVQGVDPLQPHMVSDNSPNDETNNDDDGQQEEVAQLQMENCQGRSGNINHGFKRTRRRRSTVWKYFTLDANKEFAKCSLCSLTFKATSGTSAFGRHLRSQHSGNRSLFRRKTWGMKIELGRRGTSSRTTSKVVVHPDSDEDIQTVDPLDCHQNSNDNSSKDDEDKGRLADVKHVRDCLPGNTPSLDGKSKDVGAAEKCLLAKTGMTKYNIKQPRRLRSTVWKYFTLDVNKEHAKCNICGVEYKHKSGHVSSALGRHLETQHNGNLKLLRTKMWGMQFESRSRGYRDVTTAKRNSSNSNVTDSESDEVQEDIFEADGFDGSPTEVTANKECGGKRQEGTIPRSNRYFTRRSQLGDHYGVETCFVCRTDFTKESVTQFSQREYRFLLMEILEIPTGKAMSYLEELELPEKWVALCKSCQTCVEESVIARRKIISLQLQMEKHQTQILKKIKTSDRKSPVDYPKKQRQVLDTIRNFVHSKKYSVLVDSHDINIHAENNDRIDVDPDPESDFSPASECDDGPEEPIQNEVIQSQALFCGLCADDKVYESETLLTAHTKEAHSRPLPPSPSLPSSSLCSNNDDMMTQGNSQSAELELEPVIFCSKPVPCKSCHYRYSCPNCPQVKGYTVSQYALHLGIHQRRPYQCSICSALLPAEKDIREAHWNENHSNIESPPDSDKCVQIKFSPGKLWKCESCIAGFFSEDDRDQHELSCLTSTKLRKRESLVEAKKKPYECHICELRFRNFAEWRFHRALQHSEVDYTSCYYCSESFCETTVDGIEARHDQKLLDHMHTKHRTMKILTECEPCGLVFEPGMEKTKHMTERHGVPGDKVYPCSLCDISYSDFRGVRRHMSCAHFQRSPTICDKCGAKFLLPTSLLHHNFQSHGIVPEGQEVLSCPKEGCKFKSILRGKYNLHIAQVHQSPVFICKFCGKGFKNREYLKQHEDIHRNMNTKPFQCEKCGISFAIKYYLNVHRKRQHEGRRTIRQRNRGISKGGVSATFLHENSSTASTPSANEELGAEPPNELLNL